MGNGESSLTKKRCYSARDLADLFGLSVADVAELAERGVIEARQRDGEW